MVGIGENLDQEYEKSVFPHGSTGTRCIDFSGFIFSTLARHTTHPFGIEKTTCARNISHQKLSRFVVRSF